MTPTPDLLEQRLADALGAARTDERWAVAPRPDAVDAVRRGARHRRRRTAVLSAAGAVVVLAGAIGLAGSGLPGYHDRVVAPPAAAPRADAGGPVPGVTPDWTPASGRDWLLTGEQWDAFMATHTVPESSGQSRVPSPAPLGQPSEQLLADVAPVLPPGTQTTREDSVGGNPDEAAVHVRLADGTPVEVLREQAIGPTAYDRWGGDVPPVPGTELADVPGTTAALLVVPEIGYGWGPEIPDGARIAVVVTRSGLTTRWLAPLSVPMETVRAWALAAAQRSA